MQSVHTIYNIDSICTIFTYDLYIRSEHTIFTYDLYIRSVHTMCTYDVYRRLWHMTDLWRTSYCQYFRLCYINLYAYDLCVRFSLSFCMIFSQSASRFLYDLCTNIWWTLISTYDPQIRSVQNAQTVCSYDLYKWRSWLFDRRRVEKIIVRSAEVKLKILFDCLGSYEAF